MKLNREICVTQNMKGDEGMVKKTLKKHINAKYDLTKIFLCRMCAQKHILKTKISTKFNIYIL